MENAIENFKGTVGNFKDGHKGWKLRKLPEAMLTPFKYEVVWSDDDECIADGVYDDYDAQLISHAPQLIEMLQKMLQEFNAEHASHYAVELCLEAEDLIKQATTI